MNNETRQNWHITEMMCGWKNEKDNQKDYTRRAIAKIEQEAEDKVDAVTAECKARIRKIQAEKNVAILAERHKLQEALILIAKREDNYMHEFRNYVNSLPVEDRVAFVTKGGKQ